MEKDKTLIKRLNIIASILSVVIISTVFLMRVPSLKLDLDMDLSFLPGLNAFFNSITAVFLIRAFIFIKKGKVERHRKSIYAAFFSSSLFLLTYVLYHFTATEVHYGGTGFSKYVYFFILITHVTSAGLIFPFILFTFVRGYTNQVEKHKKMARWVFPIWLYVAITGPIVYLMLKPYY